MTNEEFIKQFGTVTKKIEEESKNVDKSWWGVARSVEAIGKQVETGWPAAISKSFGKQGTAISGIESLRTFFSDPKAFKAGTAELMRKNSEIKDSIDRLKLLKTLGIATPAQKEELKLAVATHKANDDQLKVRKAISKLQLEQMTYLPAILSSIKGSAQWSEKMQVALINKIGRAHV